MSLSTFTQFVTVSVAVSTRSIVITEGPRDALSQLKSCQPLLNGTNKNLSGHEIVNVNFYDDIVHVEASAYAH